RRRPHLQCRARPHCRQRPAQPDHNEAARTMKPRPPRRGRHILLAAGALAMLLAGCAPLTRAPMLAPASRSAASAFLLEGRISATDGTRAASGRIEWRHAPGGDRWTAYSPLGQIAARLESDADGARLL